MSTKPKTEKKPITVRQVSLAALFLAVVGGMYGLYAGGLVNMIILFIESFALGFIALYTGASFIELLRKQHAGT